MRRAGPLQTAWDALLKNHAHDDICGCSVDDVHLDDVQRFHEVLALGSEMINRQIEHLVQLRLPAENTPRSARVFAFNPHPWPVSISSAVRILLPDEGGEFSEPSAARRLQAVDAAGAEVPVRVLATSCKAIRNRYLETTWGRAYEVQATFSLPPLGFEVFSFSETTEPLELATNERPEPVPESLVNAIGFELDADIGDGYSHGPLPELPVERARLVSAEADGRTTDVFHLAYEIRGRASIQRDDLAGKPLADCLGPQVTMPISVRAQRRWSGSDATRPRSFVWELRISYTNVCADSRLRVVVDPQRLVGATMLGACGDVIVDGQAQWWSLPAEPATHDLWDGPLATPAYPGEKPYPVHHTNDGVVWAGTASSSFAGGVGLHEFELVAAAESAVPAAAFTLHRAVGSLSVRGGRIRSCQAGPQRHPPRAAAATPRSRRGHRRCRECRRGDAALEGEPPSLLDPGVPRRAGQGGDRAGGARGLDARCWRDAPRGDGFETCGQAGSAGATCESDGRPRGDDGAAPRAARRPAEGLPHATRRDDHALLRRPRPTQAAGRAVQAL